MKITVGKGITQSEAEFLIDEEIGKHEYELSSIDMVVDDNEIVVTAVEMSPITRVRRITGYIVPTSHMNKAKLAEVHDRTKHIA
jgi:hypothetical protein